MTQYFAHPNTDPITRRAYPFLIEVQSPLLSGSRTTVVIPLQEAAQFTPNRNQKLNPVLQLNGQHFVLMAQQIFSVPERYLGANAFDCRSQTAAIIAAIDCLLSGV